MSIEIYFRAKRDGEWKPVLIEDLEKDELYTYITNWNKEALINLINILIEEIRSLKN